MPNPWDSWSSNTDNWSAATYKWDDHLLYPSANTLALNGYAPSEVGNYLFYPQEVTISLGGHSPDFKFSFAPSIGAGTLTINGQTPIFAKGVFTTVPQGTLTFDISKWSDISATWSAVSGTWSSYGMAPTVGQTHSYDPETGIFTITGHDLVVVRKDPTWKPTVWII